MFVNEVSMMGAVGIISMFLCFLFLMIRLLHLFSGMKIYVYYIGLFLFVLHLLFYGITLVSSILIGTISFAVFSNITLLTFMIALMGFIFETIKVLGIYFESKNAEKNQNMPGNIKL